MKIKLSIVTASLIIISACTPNKQPMGQQKPEDINERIQNPILGVVPAFDAQGHRGCRGLMPENTISAMTYALGLDVQTLEMDIVITKDKKVILSHEPFFNHEITTKPGGNYVAEAEERNLNIYKMTYAETQRYDVGLKPNPRFPEQQKMAAHKPLLSAVFDSVNNYMVTARRPMPYFNIETKCKPATDDIFHPSPQVMVDLLMAVIKEKGMEERVLIQSFDFRTLQYLHKKYPDMQTAMLIEDTDKTSFESQLKNLGFTANVYSPHYSLVNEELVKKCHDQNMRIIPWTANSKKEIDRLKAMGVDGVISDYPNLF